MIEILSSESPLQPTVTEAILSYGPWLLVAAVFLAIVVCCIRALWRRVAARREAGRNDGHRATHHGVGPVR
ncbi:hypothetical protein EAE32_00425 [Kocuria tytonicola]|uniref:Uncharacterized protein n=1 Tax=Kocuria tytonicola TaxID=2055946 RepID=A0A3L9L4Q4_9MICC|nr:hypothetical protein [Kocuria tytonicola]RLY93760.1 hypothetical protein EAE32_00425 [Kocuria tytonicola]